MQVIIITGSVATGKTTLAKKLAKQKGYIHLEVSKLVKTNKLYDYYDNKRKSYVVDIKKLNKFLIKIIKACKKQTKRDKKPNLKQIPTSANASSGTGGRGFGWWVNKQKNKAKTKGIIIDSHMAHFLPKKYVDLCIVTKCDIKTLKKRLAKRGYSKAKIRENLDCEIFDICLNEAKENGQRIKIVSDQ